MVGPAPTSLSEANFCVWNRHASAPVSAFTAYTSQSGLEPPNTTSLRPFLSVAKAGGDHEPASVWLPGGLPNLLYVHFRLQSVAPLGSTALMANSAPPSSEPSRPFSPK